MVDEAMSESSVEWRWLFQIFKGAFYLGAAPVLSLLAYLVFEQLGLLGDSRLWTSYTVDALTVLSFTVFPLLAAVHIARHMADRRLNKVFLGCAIWLLALGGGVVVFVLLGYFTHPI